MSSFRHIHKRYATKLPGHIWSLKEKLIEYTVNLHDFVCISLGVLHRTDVLPFRNEGHQFGVGRSYRHVVNFYIISFSEE